MNTDWYRTKRYPHIGMPLKQTDRHWVSRYVSNSKNISEHSFLPFIHKTIKTRRFRKEYDNSGVVMNNGLRVESSKTRHLYYSNHLDANIFSYYSSLISEEYEQKLKQLGLDKVVTAYRRIPLVRSNANARNMCNIDFANEVFDFIRNSKEQKLVALTFDIRSYFDNLDHIILKEAWCRLFNVSSLNSNHYNVFRNITKFSYVEENDLFRIFKNKIITETKSGTVKNKKIDKIKYLRSQGAISFCNKKEFLHYKKKNSIIKANKYTNRSKKGLRHKGIPQGSPISSVLANLYLLGFDAKIESILNDHNGLYRRYSDDIVVICRTELKEEVIEHVTEEIAKYKLKIQPSKTQIAHFNKCNSIKYNCFNETKNGSIIQTRNFEYLGFEFDGQFTYLKSSSLASYYRKMKKNLNGGYFYARYTKNETNRGEIFRKRLYNKFSYLGANRRRLYKRDSIDPNIWKLTHKYDWGNYLSYANLAKDNMSNNRIRSQTKRHWNILNRMIIDNERALKVGLRTQTSSPI